MSKPLCHGAYRLVRAASGPHYRYIAFKGGRVYFMLEAPASNIVAALSDTSGGFGTLAYDRMAGCDAFRIERVRSARVAA